MHVFKLSSIVKIIILSIIALVIIISLIFALRASKSSAETQEGIPLPIVMYHSVLKDPSRSGDYVVTPQLLEDDLIYLKNKGYNTINMTQLISYVHNGEPLPDKPVIITFDDGQYNNWIYASPILQKYNMKGVISIVGSYTDQYSESNDVNANYSYLRWEDIQKVFDEGILELQNHSYSLHSIDHGRKGSMKKKGESTEEYVRLFTEDITKLQNEFKEHIGWIPNTYTYPYGAISSDSLDAVKSMGFSASLSCNEGMNYITRDPECLYVLKRKNRPAHISTERFFQNMGI